MASEWYKSLCEAIHAAAEATLPIKNKNITERSRVSDRTKQLFERKAKLLQKGVPKGQLKKLQRMIKESCKLDFIEWVDACVSDMEEADKVGNTREIYKIVRTLSNKPRQPPTNLTIDENGNLLKSPEETAETWRRFLEKKFAPTNAETHDRPPMESLPAERSPDDSLTWEEFDEAVGRLKTNKAVGPDGIPAEVFKYCPSVKKELFRLLDFIWENECLPTNLAIAEFKMLYKNKGSANDPKKYRCIGLLNHAYKVIANIILARLLSCSDDYIAKWQAGFRAQRGCRDNTMLLRVICQSMLELGRSIAATFIDYSAAFDTLSHKFIDEALKDAKAPIKVRAMFRAVYEAATAFTTASDVDGTRAKSAHFGIGRGVLQGDITSPLFFILALELIMRKHDKNAVGVPMAATIIKTLGYADDITFLEDGGDEGIARSSTRVTNTSRDPRKTRT